MDRRRWCQFRSHPSTWHEHRHSFPWSARRDGWGGLPWLIAGGVVAAMLELGFAIAWWAPYGTPATHVLQGVAAWWLDRDAFVGGVPTALFGGLLYCT